MSDMGWEEVGNLGLIKKEGREKKKKIKKGGGCVCVLCVCVWVVGVAFNKHASL